jgi:hypothetical protein
MNSAFRVPHFAFKRHAPLLSLFRLFFLFRPQILQQTCKAFFERIVIFQSEKSGMKYDRTSVAISIPLSASKRSQFFIASKSTSRIGNSFRRFCSISTFRALRISVITHSLCILSSDKIINSLS